MPPILKNARISLFDWYDYEFIELWFIEFIFADYDTMYYENIVNFKKAKVFQGFHSPTALNSDSDCSICID